MGRGKDRDAVAVIHKVAELNGTTSTFSLQDLSGADTLAPDDGDKIGNTTKAMDVVKAHIGKFDGNHVKPLFATRKLAYSTFLLIVLWGMYSY